MYKFFLLLSFSTAVSYADAQTTPLTKEERRLLDSMFREDEFVKLIMGEKKSFFEIRVGAGNQLLSADNNNANAAGLTSSFVLTPAIDYHHKSGFGLAASVFFAADSGQFKPYQYAVNPYFEYYGKSVNVGVSYTRYIFNTGSNFSPNPFQNGFYGNLLYTKTFIEPGFSIGYNRGKFTDTFTINAIPRKLTVKLSDLSLSPYILHDFYFYKLFSKDDGLRFTPSLMLVAGRQQVKAPGLNSTRLDNFPRLQKILKNRFESDSKFQLQSIAASLALKYQYKKFYISPGLYVDYYLPSTTEKRLTTVFSTVMGFSF
ncbi:MAG: hypothetical protein ABIO79_02365 [Ferruginibacter sp.]